VLTTLLVVFCACFVVERVWTGWRLPDVDTWWPRVLLVNAVQLGVVLIAGITWERWLSSRSVFQLRAINPLLGGVIGYFIATFVFYWWHRWRHGVPILWRLFHQIHHSPQRIEVITSFYKHPGEMIVNSILGSAIVYSLLGLTLEGWRNLYGVHRARRVLLPHEYPHTPQWIGYVFQLPEMHRIHHQHNYHKNNYGDFVWWDMLFGTFKNPKTWNATCGFDNENEQKLGSMLLYSDVHR
jgi:sterol desaturase/sphingolipid hydroxylase (fatty acid hydroxylase superfamily)